LVKQFAVWQLHWALTATALGRQRSFITAQYPLLPHKHETEKKKPRRAMPERFIPWLKCAAMEE